MYSASVAFLRVRRINIEIKKKNPGLVNPNLSRWLKLLAEINIKFGFSNRSLSHINLRNLCNCDDYR